MRKLSYITILVFISGFLLGRFFSEKMSKKQTKTEIVSTESKKREVSTQGDVQKVVAMSQQMDYTEKHYSKKGILVKEVSYSRRDRDVTTEQQQTRSKTSSNTQSHIEKNDTTMVSYTPNFLISVYYPVSSFETKINPVELNFGLSYRLFSDVYVGVMSDVFFKRAAVGITLRL